MAVKLITDAKLKKALAGRSTDELVGLILEMSSKIKPAKEFLTVKFGDASNEEELCKKYKKIIDNEFFPDRVEPGRGSVKAARAAIKEFRQASVSIEPYVDILLYCVEQCVLFTNDYGDIDAQFYNAVEKTFEEAVHEVNEAGYELYKIFAERFKWILDNTRCIGWGFSDAMEEIYNELKFLEIGQKKEQTKSDRIADPYCRRGGRRKT